MAYFNAFLNIKIFYSFFEKIIIYTTGFFSKIMKKGKKEIIYYFILNLISKVFTYFLLLVFASLFIPSDYGEAAFIYSFFSVVTIFILFGIPDIFVVWFIKKKDVSSVFYFLISLTVFFMVVGLIISLKYILVLPLVLSLPFLLLRGIGYSFFKIKYKYHLFQFFELLFGIIILVFIILLKNLGAFGIISGYALGYVLTSLVVIWLTRKEILNVIKSIKLNFLVIKRYIKDSFIISLLTLSFAFLSWTDSIILGLLSTFESVAKYNIASPISFVTLAIPLALSQFLLNRSAQLKNEKSSLSILERTLRISLSSSLLFAIVLGSLISLIIKIFFPVYIGIEIYIIILLIGVMFCSLYSLLSVYSVGISKPEQALTPFLISVLINIVLDIILIPKFGLYGICIATTIAHITAWTLYGFKMNLLKKFALVYLSPIFIILTFYLNYYGLFLLLFLVPALFYFKLIQKQDLQIIIGTIKGLLKNG